MAIELLPLVLVADRPTTLTISGLTPGQRYVLQVRSTRQGDLLVDREFVADAEGCVGVERQYPTPGEHLVDVYASTAGERLERLHFFAAPPDLHGRRPLRCDFHIHTVYSDGRESPAEMLIRGRELGLDVAVISDHNHYGASIEAVAERDRLGLNVITMPGEEVSGPNWHILSIGADTGIYDLALQAFALEEPERREEWEQTLAWEYDALRWAVDAVHEHGGRAYLAHPYWAVPRGFHLATAMYDQILEAGTLDGIELLGDVRYENNYRSLARYVDWRAAGNDMPIIGCSDTHRAQHTYGTYWTLALAKDTSARGVLDAIANGWSVACTTLGEPEPNRRAGALQAFGPFELVDYTYFAEHHFFPRHDALCAAEASLAYRALRGEKLAEEAMVECEARMEALYARCWGID